MSGWTTSSKMPENIPTQVCVWQGIPLELDPKECLKLLQYFDYRVIYLDHTIVSAGGEKRTDLFFEIHKDDIIRFAVERFELFEATSGFLYGILFKETHITVEQQLDFFHSNNITMKVVASFENLIVFSLKLFDTEFCDDEDKQERMATEICRQLLDACKKYTSQFPQARQVEFLRSGPIRWWEDVVRNMKLSKQNIYNDEIMKKFKSQWE